MTSRVQRHPTIDVILCLPLEVFADLFVQAVEMIATAHAGLRTLAIPRQRLPFARFDRELPRPLGVSR